MSNVGQPVPDSAGLPDVGPRPWPAPARGSQPPVHAPPARGATLCPASPPHNSCAPQRGGAPRLAPLRYRCRGDWRPASTEAPLPCGTAPLPPSRRRRVTPPRAALACIRVAPLRRTSHHIAAPVRGGRPQPYCRARPRRPRRPPRRAPLGRDANRASCTVQAPVWGRQSESAAASAALDEDAHTLRPVRWRLATAGPPHARAAEGSRRRCPRRGVRRCGRC
jgi:hypothetical protein